MVRKIGAARVRGPEMVALDGQCLRGDGGWPIQRRSIAQHDLLSLVPSVVVDFNWASGLFRPVPGAAYAGWQLVAQSERPPLAAVPPKSDRGTEDGSSGKEPGLVADGVTS